MSTGTAIRVGADVVAVHQVAASVENHGARYLERIYTEHELSSCRGLTPGPGRRPGCTFRGQGGDHQGSPAGRPPARVAVDGGPSAPRGWCTIALTGYAAALADQAGIGELAVSLTHEGDVAAAVVVALCLDDAASGEQPGTSEVRDRSRRDS